MGCATPLTSTICARAPRHAARMGGARCYHGAAQVAIEAGATRREMQPKRRSARGATPEARRSRHSAGGATQPARCAGIAWCAGALALAALVRGPRSCVGRAGMGDAARTSKLYQRSVTPALSDSPSRGCGARTTSSGNSCRRLPSVMGKGAKPVDVSWLKPAKTASSASHRQRGPPGAHEALLCTRSVAAARAVRFGEDLQRRDESCEGDKLGWGLPAVSRVDGIAVLEAAVLDHVLQDLRRGRQDREGAVWRARAAVWRARSR